MGLGLYQRSWGLDIEQSLNALADGNRLRIVQIIAKENAICARDLLKELDITQPTLSHHMKALVNCGLVTGTKKGRWCYELPPISWTQEMGGSSLCLMTCD